MRSPGALKVSARRVLAVAGAVLVGGLALATPVAAHGLVDPGTAPQDGEARVAFQVTNEQDNANTGKLEMTLPDEHPMTDVQTASAPGWLAAALNPEQSDGDYGYGIGGRGPSIVADLVALTSVAIGALALARATGRIATGNGRTGAIAAMAIGLTGIVLAGVALAIADGGPGTGNGVVGSVFAIVIGLTGTVLGGLARARSRRTS